MNEDMMLLIADDASDNRGAMTPTDSIWRSHFRGRGSSYGNGDSYSY